MEKPSMMKNSMNYGAITGIALFVLFVLFSMMGMSQNIVLQLLSYGVIVAGIALGTKHYRDHVNDHHISYGQAIWSGTQIAFFCSVIIAFFMFLYLKFIDATMFEMVMSQQEKMLMDQGMDDEQIEKSMEMLKKFNNPAAYAIISTLAYTFLGFIFSLIIAAFLKKEDKSFDNFIKENE